MRSRCSWSTWGHWSVLSKWIFDCSENQPNVNSLKRSWHELGLLQLSSTGKDGKIRRCTGLELLMFLLRALFFGLCMLLLVGLASVGQFILIFISIGLLILTSAYFSYFTRLRRVIRLFAVFLVGFLVFRIFFNFEIRARCLIFWLTVLALLISSLIFLLLIRYWYLSSLVSYLGLHLDIL